MDSTTAALLLKEQGYEVLGYYFDVVGNSKEKEGAINAASELGIELITEDLSKPFKDIVITNFVDEYLKGRTPNPCIICNPNIKFKYLLKKADELGIKYIATGHYANLSISENGLIKNINFDEPDKRDAYFEEDRELFISTASNLAKDQSYMLYRLNRDVLKRLILPLGGFKSKDDVRAIAKDFRLKNAEKSDSQEICFIDQNLNYKEYILDLGCKLEPGNFVNKNGEVLGEHQGILHYTIGQRKGLGIAFGKPVFVTDINPETNEITLGNNEDLLKTDFAISDVILNTLAQSNNEIYAKPRYTSKQTEIEILSFDPVERSLIGRFKMPERAITPGQSMVLYIKNESESFTVVGGGFIK